MVSSEKTLSASGCEICEPPLGFDFTFAYQPIVNVQNETIFAYEALVRGIDGQGAVWVLDQINEKNRYRFDQECRIRSIFLAKKLGMNTKLSINFMPNAVYNPAMCIRTTLEAASSVQFDTKNIIFEVLESEEVGSPDKLKDIFKYYHEMGFSTAIDDFGSGYAGLNLLADFKPDHIKIDMHLVRNIHIEKTKQAIVRGILLTALELGVSIIAEGIESQYEAEWFIEHDVHLLQGYFFAKPKFEGLVTGEEIFSRHHI
jgi:EAL domain-containing protein (putative c-di-GMP-specific phosphodiesterase class I)